MLPCLEGPQPQHEGLSCPWQRREYMQGAASEALPEPRSIAYLLARFACNNHTICDEELRPIGAARPAVAAHFPCLCCAFSSTGQAGFISRIQALHVGRRDCGAS
jgi:hypothetical protein